MAAFLKNLKIKLQQWLLVIQKSLGKQRKKLILLNRKWHLQRKRRLLQQKQAQAGSAKTVKPFAAKRAPARHGPQRRPSIPWKTFLHSWPHNLPDLWKTIKNRTLLFFRNIPKWVRTFIGELIKFRPRAVITAVSVLAVLVVAPIIAVAVSGKNININLRSASAWELASTPTPTTEPTPTPFLLEKGMDSAVIMAIQQRLMDLGYMDADEPTEHFGPLTAREQSSYFSVRKNLEITGTIDDETMELLMGDNAEKYVVEIGVSGTDVKELQKRLYELGYLDSYDSVFGEKTQAAVQLFQQKNSLEVNGKMDEGTREMLYSDEAKANAIAARYGKSGS